MLASCVPVLKHALILLCLCMVLCMASGNFNCYSHKSSLSNTTDDATSEISCADVPGWENYTLTSCGVEPFIPNDDGVDGARMIVAGKCVAINGLSGQGVYAWIRCCDFSHIGRASSVALPRWQANGWNKRNTSNCSSVGAQYITGCNAWSPWSLIYWAFPGTFDPYTNSYDPSTDYPLTQQSCTVVDGGSSDDLTRPTSGSGTCLSFSSNNVELVCVTRMSTTSTVNNPVVTSVSCGDGYAMTGCSGLSQNGNANAWYIENDVCYFKGEGGQATMRAIAICCMLHSFAPTLSLFLSNFPTPQPTASPTLSPTHWPSHPPLPPTDSNHLVAIMPIFNSPTFSPTYSPINWSTHVPSSSFDDNLAPTGSSSFVENSPFVIILCASIALAVICCLGWAGVVFARTYIFKHRQNIKDDSDPMFEDGIEDQQQNIVPGAPQQQQQQPSPAMFRPYHHQIMINPMNVQRVNSNFGNDEKMTAEGDADEDECDDDGEQRQFGQSISEASDSSLMMHDDHWAVLKVTNFHGVDDAHKCEIFETDKNHEQNVQHIADGAETKTQN